VRETEKMEVVDDEEEEGREKESENGRVFDVFFPSFRPGDLSTEVEN